LYLVKNALSRNFIDGHFASFYYRLQHSFSVHAIKFYVWGKVYKH